MKLINMCGNCEDKLFAGIECRGCRCPCHTILRRVNQMCKHYSVHRTGVKDRPYQCDDCLGFFTITKVGSV